MCEVVESSLVPSFRIDSISSFTLQEVGFETRRLSFSFSCSSNVGKIRLW